MDNYTIAALEAVLFCSGDSITVDKLCEIFEATPLQMNQWLEQLDTSLAGRGIQLRRIEDEVQLVSRKDYNIFIQGLLERQRPSRLSAPTLETLAIIAYRQPITRPEIEEVRGVKVEKALSTLLGFDLVTEVGRRETPGRPILYGTTEEFLRHFGITDLSDLPTPDPE